MRMTSPPARDVIAAGLGLLMVSGVYLDGWAHLNRPGLETFFTPWHAILYSGFTLLAVFTGLVGLRRGGRFGWSWSPPYGYGPAAAGVLVFAAGGVGDMLWHEIFGIEVAIDALVSPTHLVLLIGGMLMVTAPMRAARADSTPAGLSAVSLSVAATAALAAFFLSYLSVFADAGASLPLTLIPEGAPGHREGELPAVAGLGAYLASTAAFLLPVLAQRRLRTSWPTGSAFAAVTAVALLGTMLTGFRYLVPAVAAVIGAFVVEVSRRWWPARADAWLILAAALPASVWAGQLTGMAISVGVAWPVELWAGIVVLTGLAGLAVALVSAPARLSSADSRRIRNRRPSDSLRLDS